MPKKTGETLCEIRGNVRGNGMKHVGNCRLRGYLTHLVTSSQEDLYRFIQTEQPENVGKSPLFFPGHYCKATRNLSANGKMAEALDAGFNYLAVEFWVTTLQLQLILLQIFGELIDLKLSLSRKIKTKQVFIIFNGGEHKQTRKGPS